MMMFAQLMGIVVLSPNVHEVYKYCTWEEYLEKKKNAQLAMKKHLFRIDLAHYNQMM